MKTIKLLSAFLVLIYSSSYSQSLDNYISESSAVLCQEMFYLGKKIDIQNNAEKYDFDQRLRVGVYGCNEMGIFNLGTGDHYQDIYIDKISFILDDENRIYNMSARWRELKYKYKQYLADIKSGKHSVSEDLRKNMELAETNLNDLDKMMYEIERQFGPSTSVRPVTWEAENYSFDFSRSSNEIEYIYLVSVQSKQ